MNIEVVFQPFACSQTSCANGTEGKVPRRGNAGAEGTCICHFERLRIALQLHFLALGPQGEEKRQLLSQALGIEERADGPKKKERGERPTTRKWPVLYSWCFCCFFPPCSTLHIHFPPRLLLQVAH